jgi:hypothetical protein
MINLEPPCPDLDSSLQPSTPYALIDINKKRILSIRQILETSLLSSHERCKGQFALWGTLFVQPYHAESENQNSEDHAGKSKDGGSDSKS